MQQIQRKPIIVSETHISPELVATLDSRGQISVWRHEPDHPEGERVIRLASITSPAYSEMIVSLKKTNHFIIIPYDAPEPSRPGFVYALRFRYLPDERRIEQVGRLERLEGDS